MPAHDRDFPRAKYLIGRGSMHTDTLLLASRRLVTFGTYIAHVILEYRNVPFS